MALGGRCFSALFGTPFGPGALPNLKPRIVCWTPVVLVYLDSLVGASAYFRIVSLTTSMTAGTDGSFSVWNRASALSASVSGFSQSERASPSGVTNRGDGVGILITRLVMFHSDWPSRSKISSFKLHFSFFHSFSLLVNDLCRRLTLGFRSWSLEICRCLHFCEFHPAYEPVWVPWVITWATFWRGLCQSFWEFLNTSFDSHLIREVRIRRTPRFQASPALDQTVLLKSGRSRGLRKYDRHRVSVCIRKWSKLGVEHVFIQGLSNREPWGWWIKCQDFHWPNGQPVLGGSRLQAL